MPCRAMRRPDPSDPWSPAERAVLRRLSTPACIHGFLDELAYRTEDEPASPHRVLADREDREGDPLAGCEGPPEVRLHDGGSQRRHLDEQDQRGPQDPSDA